MNGNFITNWKKKDYGVVPDKVSKQSGWIFTGEHGVIAGRYQVRSRAWIATMHSRKTAGEKVQLVL